MPAVAAALISVAIFSSVASIAIGASVSRSRR
jgi:hypothetical protein